MTDRVDIVWEPEDDVILVAGGRDLHAVRERGFRDAVRDLPSHTAHRRDFMTDAHVRVREHVVREMRARLPLAQDDIASALGMPVPQVAGILDDLERHLFFLVRADNGAVTWAFPVTVEPTPHQVRFPGGDLLYAA